MTATNMFSNFGGFRCRTPLKVLYHKSANLPYALRMPLQILKRANLERLRPVVYLLSAFYTQNKPRPAFPEKATYTPPLAYLKLRNLITVTLVTGHLYNEIHIVRNRKFTQALP